MSIRQIITEEKAKLKALETKQATLEQTNLTFGLNLVEEQIRYVVNLIIALIYGDNQEMLGFKPSWILIDSMWRDQPDLAIEGMTVTADEIRVTYDYLANRELFALTSNLLNSTNFSVLNDKGEIVGTLTKNHSSFTFDDGKITESSYDKVLNYINQKSKGFI